MDIKSYLLSPHLFLSVHTSGWFTLHMRFEGVKVKQFYTLFNKYPDKTFLQQYIDL